MNTWILILTIMVSNAGTQIEHIKDFESEKACNIAGEAWKNQLLIAGGNGLVFYSCVNLNDK